MPFISLIMWGFGALGATSVYRKVKEAVLPPELPAYGVNRPVASTFSPVGLALKGSVALVMLWGVFKVVKAGRNALK